MKDYKSGISIKSLVDIEDSRDLETVDYPGSNYVAEKIVENMENLDLYTSRSHIVAMVSDGSDVKKLGNIGPIAVLPVLEARSGVLGLSDRLGSFPLPIFRKSVKEMASTIKEVSASFGAINIESMDPTIATQLEKLLIDLSIPVYNDNLKGVPIVVLSTILSSLKLSNREIKDIKIVVDGTGLTSLTVVELLIAAGVKNLLVTDKNGIISPVDQSLNTRVRVMAGTINPDLKEGSLFDALDQADIYINLENNHQFRREYIDSMIDPIIIDLSSNSEYPLKIEDMYAGAYIVATTNCDLPNCITPALVQPGIIEGLIESKQIVINTDMMLKVSYALAKYMENNLSRSSILPTIEDKSIIKVLRDTIIDIGSSSNRI